MVFDSLFAREKLGSTGLGQGIAIPHGRIKGLKDAWAPSSAWQSPFPFDAPPMGVPYPAVLCSWVPEQTSEHHLQLLPNWPRCSGDRGFREQLLNAPDALAAHALFAQWGSDARQPSRDCLTTTSNA